MRMSMRARGCRARHIFPAVHTATYVHARKLTRSVSLLCSLPYLFIVLQRFVFALLWLWTFGSPLGLRYTVYGTFHFTNYLRFLACCREEPLP